MVELKKNRHAIFDELERLHKLKVEREFSKPAKICTVYSPVQDCVGSKCIWFDVSDMSCWVLNPKPKKFVE
ncbi:MAG: hypothetical protein ABH834_00470 [Candidatus Altiarchaeota archaeon]